MSREAIAYLLIAVIVLALAAVIAWKLYDSRDRRLARQWRQEKARLRAMMEKDGPA